VAFLARARRRRLESEPSHPGRGAVRTVSRRLVIFLSGAGWPSRYQAVTVGVTAAALGDAVTLVLSFDALQAFLTGRFDEGAPPTVESARSPPLSQTLAEARRELGLRVVACETSVRLVGHEVEAARALLDALEPLPTTWRLAQDGRTLTF
jgi:predicted peroxiredoxin